MLAGIAGDAALEALRRATRGESGDLVRASGERVAATLSELRGAAMKLGQLLSLQGEDLLPRELAELLAGLRCHADAMPESQVRAVLAGELGPDWEARFAELDFEPLAAASIGQVHAAQTRDGRDVALKLQYPGVDASIDADVDNLAALLRVFRLLPPQLEIELLLPELKRALAREADYRREARCTERYRKLVSDDPGVFVPRVHADLSTRRVLATDRVWALPIEDLRSPEHPQQRRDRTARRLMALVLRELFEFRFMQTDPNFANYMYEPKGERVALLDFGAARAFPRRFTEAYRRLIAAAVEGSERDVVGAGAELGFLAGGEPAPVRRAFVELVGLSAEPLRARGRYDFAASDLARRVRERSIAAYREHALPRPPLPTLFLHRKLAGSFLLCAHIGAAADCRALYAERIRP